MDKAKARRFFDKFAGIAMWGGVLAAGLEARAVAPATGGTGGDALAGTLTVTVVADGTTDPIAGATVWVGPAEGDPFAGNVALTDGSGVAVFNDPALTGTISVSAGAAGRAYATVFDLAVSEVVLPLPALAPPPTARLGNQFSGIEVNNGFLCSGDGNLDLGFVFRAVPLASALGGSSLLDLFFSPTTEPFNLPLGMTADVPSNLYAPSQCETLLFYSKTSYHLRVPTGRQTIYGLSVRGPLGAFLALQDGELDTAALVELVSQLDFREMDLLRDLSVTGDSEAVDLNADLSLSSDLVLQFANTLPGTSIFAAAGGRLPIPGGGDELLITGLDAFDPDAASPPSQLTVTTRDAVGELSELIHGALVAHLADDDGTGSDGASVALRRDGFLPPATLTFDSFFDIVVVAATSPTSFGWSDVVSATSPQSRELNRSRVTYRVPVPDLDMPGNEIEQSQDYWILYSRGDRQQLALPELPTGAPTAFPEPSSTPEQDALVFQHEVLHLGDAPAFDFDQFAFDDIGEFTTHLSSSTLALTCDTMSEVANLRLAKGPVSGEITLTWDPSPDVCHDVRGGRGYEVWAGDDPQPTVEPGSWPDDPLFVLVTDDDLDGSLADTSFTHVPDPGLQLYVVIDRGSSGNQGPAGHYGSTAP